MAGLLKRLIRAPVAREPITGPRLAAAVGDPEIAARIAVRVSTKARRVTLRVDVGTGQIVLVQPRRMNPTAVLAFAAAKRNWIVRHLAAMPPRIAFIDGMNLPLRGEKHLVRFAPDRVGGVWRENGKIVVAGRIEHAPRRLTDWLKGEARAVIASLAREMAEKLDRKLAAVSVRDTRSRWGSCSHSGRLSFSWRLILAPDHVFTYVVAHEMAHLKHMNHGAGFWRTVDELMPTGSPRLARDWLRRQGAVLHCYG